MPFVSNDVTYRYFKVTRNQIIQVEIHPLGSDDWYNETHSEQIFSILAGRLNEKFETEALQRRRKHKRKDPSSLKETSKSSLKDTLVTVNGPTLRLAYAFKPRLLHSKHLLITRFGSQLNKSVCMDHSIWSEKLVVYVWLLEKYRRHLQANEVKSSVSDYFTGAVNNHSDKQQTLKTMLDKGRSHKRKKSSRNDKSEQCQKRRKSSLDLETFMFRSHTKASVNGYPKKSCADPTKDDCAEEGCNKSQTSSMAHEVIREMEKRVKPWCTITGTIDSNTDKELSEYLCQIKGDCDKKLEDSSSVIIESNVERTDEKTCDKYLISRQRNNRKQPLTDCIKTSEPQEDEKEKPKHRFRGNGIVDKGSPTCDHNDTVSQICLDVYHSLQEKESGSKTLEVDQDGCTKIQETHWLSPVKTAASVGEKIVLPCNSFIPKTAQSSGTETFDRKRDAQNEESRMRNVANLLYDFESDDSDFLKSSTTKNRKEQCKYKNTNKLRRKKGGSNLQGDGKVDKVLKSNERQVASSVSPKPCDISPCGKLSPEKDQGLHKNLPRLSVDLVDFIVSKSNTETRHDKVTTELVCEEKSQLKSPNSGKKLRSPSNRNRIELCTDKKSVSGVKLSGHASKDSETDELTSRLRKREVECSSSDSVRDKVNKQSSDTSKWAISSNTEMPSASDKGGHTDPSDISEESKDTIQSPTKCPSGRKLGVVLSSESEDNDWAEKLLAKRKKRFKFKKKDGSSVCSQSYDKSQEVSTCNNKLRPMEKFRFQKTLGSSDVKKRNNLRVKPKFEGTQMENRLSIRKPRTKDLTADSQSNEENEFIGINSDSKCATVDKNDVMGGDSGSKLLDRIKLEIFDPPQESTEALLEGEDIFSDCFILDTFKESELTPDEKLELQISQIKKLPDLTTDQLNYMISKNEGFLKEIFQGKRTCRRHEVYKAGGKGRVDLTYQVQLNVITESQQDVVMEKLISIFCKRHHKYLDYILKVMLPEILIKIYMDLNHTTHAETEAQFWNFSGTSGLFVQ